MGLGCATSVACASPIVFPCTAHDQCVAGGGQPGTCEDAGFCSFPDRTCASRRRYSPHAGAGLAGLCVAWDEQNGAHPLDTDSGGDAGTTEADPGETELPGADEDCESEDVVIVAALAECTDPVTLDPEACEAAAGPGHVVVDAAHSNLAEQPAVAFLRFAIDPPVGTAVALHLELDVPSHDESDGSGEVWVVEAFDFEKLKLSQPKKISSTAVAHDLGYVGPASVARFTLPPDLLDGDPSDLHLGVFPTSIDAIRYANLRGPSGRHPRLVVRRCKSP